MAAVLREKPWIPHPLAQLNAQCSSALLRVCAGGLCKHRGAVGWSGEPLLNFGLFPCWAASAAGTGLSAELAFYSQIFFSFKPVGVGLHPKLQKNLEKGLGS